jgi:hypothetical protein
MKVPFVVATRRALVVLLGMVLSSAVGIACAPRLKPLGGDLAPAVLPNGQLPPGHRQIVFDWEYSDPDLSGKGNGVARIAAPDSVRLDFFLAGGFAGGAAVLIGDTLQTPGFEIVRRLIPPPTLLWATLGRSVFPVTSDTVLKKDGDLLRADLGRPVQWRVTFRGDTILRLERVEGGRIAEWIERSAGNYLEYRQETARRTLKMHITRVDAVGDFDASIWHISR